MQLNHINLPVPDVAASADFLREFFGLDNLGPSPTPAMALLTDGTGMVLNLSNFDRATEVTYPPAFHVGFTLGSREEVDAVHRRMAAAGVTAPEPQTFHGSWTFYVHVPGGFTVEVQCLGGA